MTDVYRSALRCPGCANVELRLHGRRTVCDGCGGVLLAVAEFEAALRELDASATELTVRAGAETDVGCPRCGRPLARGEATYGKRALKADFLVCGADGVWLSQDAMVAAFAQVSRAANPRASSGAPAPMAPPTSGSGQAAMAGIASAFGGGLLVGGSGQKRAAVRTPFASAFAGKTLVCADCGDVELRLAHDRYPCATCGGAFVEDAALLAMVQEMTSALWEAGPSDGPLGKRPCPVCRAPMHDDAVEAIAVARCSAHGTWFAAGDLGKVLVAVLSAHPRRWLRRQ